MEKIIDAIKTVYWALAIPIIFILVVGSLVIITGESFEYLKSQLGNFLSNYGFSMERGK